MKIGAAPLVAVAATTAGVGLIISGVYVLFGLGWCLLAGALPMLALAFITTRGIIRA